jgi:hypothetical protein
LNRITREFNRTCDRVEKMISVIEYNRTKIMTFDEIYNYYIALRVTLKQIDKRYSQEQIDKANKDYNKIMNGKYKNKNHKMGDALIRVEQQIMYFDKIRDDFSNPEKYTDEQWSFLKTWSYSIRIQKKFTEMLSRDVFS